MIGWRGPCGGLTLRTIGTAGPVGALSGTTAFTWITPATSPGAGPAYCIEAVVPPIATLTGSVEPGAGAGVMLPVIAPATGMPVANI